MESRREKLFVVAAFVATVLLSLKPFFGIGFTTDDDFQYYLTARTPFSNWMNDARIYAEGAGRFYFLVTKVFYYVPYIFDSFAWTKAVQYITLLSCYGMFAYVISRMFRSQKLGVLTLLLLVWNTQVTTNLHIPTIAYPFYFTFSSIIFMAGLLLYLRYTERGGYWRVIVSAVLMLVCFLFYETYMVFALLLGIAIVARHRFRLGSRELWRETLPLMGAAVLYVGCYVGYRQYLLAATPDLVFYDGSSFDPQRFSMKGFFNIITRCTRGALPMQNYFGNKSIIADNSLLLSGHSNSLLSVWTHASATVWVNAVLQAGLMWWITKGEWFRSLTWKRIGQGIGLAVVAAFASHTLIGVATKYNVEWSGWISGYVTTFYSFLFVALAIALLVSASLKAFNSPKTVTAMRVVWCVLMLFTSVVIGYANEHIAREWKKDSMRERIIDKVARTGYFDTLPEDAIIYTEEMHFTPGLKFVRSYQTQDIEFYIMRCAGRNLNLACDSAVLSSKRVASPEAPVYYMHAQCSPKNGDMLMAIARMDSTCSAASVADVFYMSPAKNYTVVYRSADGWQTKTVSAGRRERLTSCRLEDAGIDPRSIIVSNMVEE